MVAECCSMSLVRIVHVSVMAIPALLKFLVSGSPISFYREWSLIFITGSNLCRIHNIKTVFTNLEHLRNISYHISVNETTGLLSLHLCLSLDNNVVRIYFPYSKQTCFPYFPYSSLFHFDNKET